MGRPALTEEQVQEARERIRIAATRVFERLGYEAATMRAIAREAGLSAATPYLYFPNKAALLTAVRAEGFRLLAAALERTESITDPVERLLEVARRYVAFGLERPDLYRVMFEIDQEEFAHLPEMQAAREAAFVHARTAAHQAATEGRIAGDPHTVANLVWAHVHGILALHFAHQLDRGRDLEALLDGLAVYWEAAALHPTPPPTRPKNRSTSR